MQAFILKGTYGTGVEALPHPASLGRLQGQVLAQPRVEAEGEREAASHPLPLLEAPRRRLHVQQHLGPVVVGQRHAAHQAVDAETESGRRGQRGQGTGCETKDMYFINS